MSYSIRLGKADGKVVVLDEGTTHSTVPDDAQFQINGHEPAEGMSPDPSVGIYVYRGHRTSITATASAAAPVAPAPQPEASTPS